MLFLSGTSLCYYNDGRFFFSLEFKSIKKHYPMYFHHGNTVRTQ